MKEKLELKHLAAYLPYRLKGNLINDEYFEPQLNKELYRIETGKTEIYKAYDVGVIVGDYESNIDDFKPVLRPLSDLTKDEFKDIVFPRSEFTKENIEYHRDMCVSRIIIQRHTNQSVTFYETVQRLLSLHFDVFGLIDKELAVDINTLPHA